MSRSSGVPTRLLGALAASLLAGLLLAGVVLPVVGSLGLAAKASADDFLTLPDQLITQPPPTRSKMVAADGSLLAQLYKENRLPAKLSDVPPLTQKALIAIEDARFYAHNGIDLKGTLRAAAENAKSGAVSQGGSTITQQYVKNALLLAAGNSKDAQAAARARTTDRKLKEARYALALEQKLSKDEILERYFNIAYFGNGAYGIAAAANFYFGVPARELTLAQGATLAGIVNSPGRYDPVKAQKDSKFMTALIDRRNLVLRRMRGEGFITERQRAVASAVKDEPGAPLFTIRRVESGCENTAVRAPFFCDYVRYALERTNLVADFAGKSLRERQDIVLGGGLTIKTSLDPAIQAAAQRSVEEAVPPADPEQIGAVADIVEPGTGLVKAMAVNRRYTDSKKPGNSKLNLAVGGSNGFQPGSTFKAFVLAAAIKQGIPLSFTRYAPQRYTSKVFKDYTPDGIKPYTLSNAGDSEAGTFDMIQATHDSVNTYFIQLLEKTGVKPAADIAESLGVQQFQDGRPSAPLGDNGSFVLGTNEVSPLAMAAAYAGFANHGTFCPPALVTELLRRDGSPMKLNQPGCSQVLDPTVADTVTKVLTGVIDGSTRGRTGAAASIGRPAAGKTGTTDGSNAAWFVGYTPQLATAVWVGDPGKQPKPLKNIVINGRYYTQMYGGDLPAIIWQRTMSRALADAPVEQFQKPGTVLPDGSSAQTGTVPDVRSLTTNDARAALRAAGYDVVDAAALVGSGVPLGTAAYTVPAAGEQRDPGTVVTLYHEASIQNGSGSAPAPTGTGAAAAPTPSG